MTDCKKRRKGMPKIDNRLKKGQASSRSSDNLLVIKWVDKKEIYMLSIINTTEFATVFRHEGKKFVQKPVCEIDYNNSMGTVDKAENGHSTVNSTHLN